MASVLRYAAALVLAAAATAAAAGVEDAYFVQDGPTLFKAVLPDGSSYRFEFDASRPGRLVSGFGWEGSYSADGRVELRSPSGDAVLGFDRGRLVRYSAGGEETRFAYDTPRSAPTNSVTPLAILLYDEKEVSERYIENEESVKWTETGRLAFPYVNPNFSGALFAQLALLFLGLSLLPPCPRRAKVPLRVLAALAAACTAWSGSRGALLGLFAGALAAAAPFAAAGITRRRLAVWLGVSAAAVAAALLVLGPGNLLRGFSGDGGLDWSNALRVEMMKAAPRMIADAPGGWAPFGVGKAFTFWYQPLGMVLMSGSLINSHLTWLAFFGGAGRFLLLFATALVLSLSLWLAFRRRIVLPAAVFVGFFAMACFNPMYGVPGLWIVPALASAVLLASLRGVRPAAVLAWTGGCALAAAAALGVLLAAGAADGTRPSIRYDGRRVAVNGIRPRIWIVDDGQGVLGGVLVGREIREFYARNPRAPSVGYVRDVHDLPESGIDRLVLPGRSGNDWLLWLSEDEKARAKERLPGSVAFLNPPFSPSEMPQGVLALCRPSLFVGEFAARYNPEYSSPPAWVSVVPGAEKYIPGWMTYALGE